MAINFLSENEKSAFNEIDFGKQSIKNTDNSSITNILEYNSHRQGIELRIATDLYQNSKMKLWTGKILPDGKIEQGLKEEEINSIGQTPSFTATTGIVCFTEQEIKFDPVSFVSNSELYSYPIETNGGLPSQIANIIEPFPISYRLKSIESGYIPKGIRGFLNCGPLDGLNNGNQVISQFVLEHIDNSIENAKPFLDLGQTVLGGITIPGYKIYKTVYITAYTEKENNSDSLVLNSDSNFESAIAALKYSRDNDIRKCFEIKSCNAGASVSNMIYNYSGTDSIAYNGKIRGS